MARLAALGDCRVVSACDLGLLGIGAVVMGARFNKRTAAWKATRDGRKAHYFIPLLHDLRQFDKSLCGISRHHESLDVLDGDFPLRWRCVVCTNKHGPV